MKVIQCGRHGKVNVFQMWKSEDEKETPPPQIEFDDLIMGEVKGRPLDLKGLEVTQRLIDLLNTADNYQDARKIIDELVNKGVTQ